MYEVCVRIVYVCDCAHVCVENDVGVVRVRNTVSCRRDRVYRV